MATSFSVGAPIWVPDPVNGYCDCKVVSQAGAKVTVEFADDAKYKPAPDAKTKAPKTVFEADAIFERDPNPRNPVCEMDSMGMMNQAEVLENVHTLFQQDQSSKPGGGDKTVIYSSVGPVLISMNPFKTLPIYGEEWMGAFQKCHGDKVSLKKLGPHAYATGDAAYHGLMAQVERKDQCCNQAVVICGESGAGKTYTNRHMLEYLCVIGKGSGGGADPAAITSANELLESFGNATTTRNDNSSRFGKLTELYYEDNMTVCSCEVKHYLIERSRIMGAPPEERNYHIFYQLVRGGENAKYKLETDANKYNAIQLGADIKQPGVYESDDKSDYAALVKRMEKAKFSAEQITSIFEQVAAVLHFGDVVINGDSDKSSCANGDALKNACAFLGIDASKLAAAVCKTYIKVPGSPALPKDISKAKAVAQLEAVAKLVYSRTFDQIVEQITTTLRMKETDKTIGLLDIFGFEDMQINGFEQMFINLTNERIQHLFNTIMFDREKKVYSDDGIDSSFLKGPNNIECVNTFVKGKTCIVRLITEQVKLGVEDEKADGEVLVNKFNKVFGAKHPYFKVATPQEISKVCKTKHIMSADGKQPGLKYEECFSILHYAGVVTYTVREFIPKSRDHLGDHVSEILKGSTKAGVQKMFDDAAEEQGKEETVGSKFAQQLEELAKVLGSGETLFVRCIKSNPQKQQIPVLDRQSVFEQLTRGGVIAALEIRNAGLPDQLLYKDFVHEFSLLEIGTPTGDCKERASKIINNILGDDPLKENKIKLGKTKVFMKSGFIGKLRAAAKFKADLYCRRVQRLLGSARVRKIDNLQGMIDQLEQLANDHGLTKYKSVSEAIANATAKVKPIVDKLQAAKAQHGAQNWDKLQEVMDPLMDEVKALRPLIDKAKMTVNSMDQKRQKFMAVFSARISGGVQACFDLGKRIEAVETEAKEMSDVPEAKADVDTALASCATARGKLKELSEKTLPALQAGGLESIDLEAATSPDDPCPKVTTLLAEVEKLVVEAEKLGHECLKVMRAFMELTAQLEAAHQAAQAELGDLGPDAARCAAEGMKEVSQPIKAAAEKDFQLSRIIDKRRDPEGLQKVHDEFIALVAKAKEAVQGGLVELERRERERAERNEIDRNLDIARSKVNGCESLIGKAVMKPPTYDADMVKLEEMRKAITDLQSKEATMALDDLRTRGKELCTAAETMTHDIAVAAEGAQAEHKEGFRKKLEMWQHK